MVRILSYALPLLLLLSVAFSAHAQEPEDAAAKPEAAVNREVAAPPPSEDFSKPFEGSLFLTPLEIAAIRMTMAGDPVQADVLTTLSGHPELAGKTREVAPNRVIKISGMVFRKAGDWIVWMNGHKVTPKRLLPEIVDIKVSNSSYVDLKWYDYGINNVISIRLRPHQVYDIDTGILLPSK